MNQFTKLNFMQAKEPANEKTAPQQPKTPKVEASKDNTPKEDSAKNGVVEKLEVAAKDLLYISETDAPLTPFFWPGDKGKLMPDIVVKNAKLPTGTSVSTQTLDEFFEPVVTAEDWMNDEEKAEVQRFENLKKTLEANLKNITVFRLGETNIDVFVAGQTENGWAGVQTKVVET